MSKREPERALLICVLGSSISLPREVNLRLLSAAQALHATRARGIDLEKNEVCEGRVTTNWGVEALGAFAGPVFEAEVEIASRHGRARFIVPEAWLEADLDPDALIFRELSVSH